jgi:2',3'-cyclic-nucleotide 2'-phosphodiesterase
MRILFLGDVVGRPGYAAITDLLPSIRQELALDFIAVNAENAADGSGLTVRQFHGLVSAGVDAITMGDHIYRKLEIKPLLEADQRIVKPANFPAASPGRPWTVVAGRDGAEVAVISLLGRVFMRPVDCPFAAIDRALAEIPDTVKIRVVDVHAEATSDKQTLARYLDGRVSAVLGTHTHVPTADPQILPGGTAYQTDLGMSGPYQSIIGRDIDRVMQTTTTFEPVHFHVATGDVRLCGAVIDVDPASGRATAIARFERSVTSG